MKDGTEIIRISMTETLKGESEATSAAVAALMGEATTAMPAEITDAAIGRSGRTRACVATSATTG